jgi:beta-1,4-mannosyl-glycoprotein beta-1,4-N-acetylglucosaminyltransferase
MVIDCVLYNGELQMLKSRLTYLDTVVDLFVIIESDTAFSGDHTGYTLNCDLLEQFQHKIRHVKYSPHQHDPELMKLNFAYKPAQLDFSAAHWQLEAAQRNFISTALTDLPTETIIMISDVDEIPCKEQISLAIEKINKGAISIACEQQMFYYNFNTLKQTDWCGTVITNIKNLKARSAQWLRDQRFNMPRIKQAGWHLSYFGTEQQIQQKILSFSHQEYNTTEYTDLDKISHRITQNQDIFDRKSDLLKSYNRSALPTEITAIFGGCEIVY